MNPRSSERRATPLRERVRAAAADAILEATEAVVIERGLDGASCAAIAERAGVAVGTLYNYFPDRDGLLAALFRTRRAQIGPRLVAAGEAGTALPFEARLRRYVADVLAIFDDHRRFIQVALEAEQANGRPKLPGRDARPVMTQMHDAMEAIIAAGVASGAVTGGLEDVQARSLVATIKAIAVHRIQQQRPFAGDADLIVELFLHGAARRPRSHK